MTRNKIKIDFDGFFFVNKNQTTGCSHEELMNVLIIIKFSSTSVFLLDWISSGHAEQNDIKIMEPFLKFKKI